MKLSSPLDIGMVTDILLLDSITDARADARGRIAICGSHGGTIAAAMASQADLRAVILNDAGIGLNEAGLRGVMALDSVGMAAATVDCHSACIGSAGDMLENGRLSAVNRTAKALGLYVGQRVDAAKALLHNAPSPSGALATPSEARFEVELSNSATPVICADSASLITPEDESRVIVTGSHGGLIGNDPSRACRAQASFVAFNDAGGGKHLTGHGRLATLDDKGVAAAVLDAMSCEIGDARSSLEHGRISALNSLAAANGLRIGDRLFDALEGTVALTDQC